MPQYKKRELLSLFAAYIIAALTSGPVSGYSIMLFAKDILYHAKRNELLIYPILAFPWLLFLAAGMFLYIKESGWNERALFVLLFFYVTLFNLPHPWILELILLTPK